MFGIRKRNKKKDQKYSVVPAMKLAGHNFFRFENPGRMPKLRELAYMNAMNDVEIGVMRQDCLAYTKLIDDTLKHGMAPEEKLTEITKYNGYFQSMLMLPSSQKPLMYMGHIFTMMDNEDPEDLSAHWADAKLKLAEANPEVKAFFLKIGWSVCDISEANKENYANWDYTSSKTAERVEKTFLNLIHSYENGKADKT